MRTDTQAGRENTLQVKEEKLSIVEADDGCTHGVPSRGDTIRL